MAVGVVTSYLDLVVFVDLTEVLFQKILHLHHLSVVLVHCSVGRIGREHRGDRYNTMEF